MIRYSTVINALLIFLPLVNFSLIAGLGIPLVYLLYISIIPFILFPNVKLPRETFGFEDLVFCLFITASIVSVWINWSEYDNCGNFSQLINWLMTYLIYKITLVLVARSGLSSESVLRRFYFVSVAFQVIAIVIFFAGLSYPLLYLKFVDFINSSGNFSIGAISTEWPRARLLGFAPEPSFWGLFVAVTLAVAFSLRNIPWWTLGINFASVFLTGSRTAYFIVALLIFVKLFQGHLLVKTFVAGTVLAIVFYFSSYLDLDFLVKIDDSFRQRFGSLIDAGSIILDHPIFGIGLANFRIYSQEMNLDYFDIFNLFIALAVGVGLVGALLFLATLLLICLRTREDLQLICIAAILGWLTLSAYNLPYIWFLFGVTVKSQPFKGMVGWR